MKKKFLIFIAACSFLGCGGEETEQYTGTKVEWLNDAFSTIISDPDIKAISYWNENWEDVKPVRMKINSSSTTLATYQEKVADSYFKTDLIILNGKVTAPSNGTYHCAYPGFSEENGLKEVVTADKINDFISNSQKEIGWVYFSNSWHNGIDFPTNEVQIIDNEGKTPFIRMMPWSVIAPHLQQADPEFTMQKIIDGTYDSDLMQWALDLKSFAKPTLIEFGPEVDGDWMPWNARWNGGSEMSYGDASIPDGAERFRDAFRHIIDLFKNAGVTNATWVFHVNYSASPDEEWNNMKYYYPGDDYIDWLGVSIYGALYQGQEWSYSFSEMWSYVKPKLIATSSTKPIAILEFGAGE